MADPAAVARAARWGAGGLLGFGLVAVVAAHTALISDDSMAPSVLPGDVVLLWSKSPALGDVVAVIDPLDPSGWTLRRVEAIGGAISYSGGSYVYDNEPALLEMGKDDIGFSVVQEGSHLTRHRSRNVSYAMETTGVPDDSAWVGADNRDEAIDSRWWGPVPLDVIQGTVLLRVGAPRNRWRSWVDATP